MRVLTVGNMYPPHHSGGYEQVWQSAVEYLRDRGHEVRILTTGLRHAGVADGNEPDVHRTLRWYWRDHAFPRLGLAERVRLERRNHAVLARHLDELEPDVVGFWSMGGMSHSLIEGVRRRGLPIVLFVHDLWLEYGPRVDQWLRLFAAPRRTPVARLVGGFTGLPTRVGYGGAGRYVFVSDFVRRRALALDLGLRDADVAPSGIEPGFLASPHPERAWDWCLLHVGRLDATKGIEDAVAALTDLPETATLTFVGRRDAPGERVLEELVAELALSERVTLLGHRTHGEIAALYAEHDAVLFPVRWEEPWGLVPLEAMAAGCPVIATGQGGSGEYLDDGENCVLVPPADPAALARAVRRLAEDPALRARLRAGGRETAPRYTESIFNSSVEAHLVAAAARPRSR